MTKAERNEKRAAKAASRQKKLEARILRDWTRAIKEDRRRTIDRFCYRNFGYGLDECIRVVRGK